MAEILNRTGNIDGTQYDLTDPEQLAQFNEARNMRFDREQAERNIAAHNATANSAPPQPPSLEQIERNEEKQRLEQLFDQGNVIAGAELGYAIDLGVIPTFADILAVYPGDSAKVQTVMNRYRHSNGGDISPIALPQLTQINGLNPSKGSISIQTDQGKFYIPTSMTLEQVQDHYTNNRQNFDHWVQQQIEAGNITL